MCVYACQERFVKKKEMPFIDNFQGSFKLALSGLKLTNLVYNIEYICFTSSKKSKYSTTTKLFYQ